MLTYLQNGNDNQHVQRRPLPNAKSKNDLHNSKTRSKPLKWAIMGTSVIINYTKCKDLHTRNSFADAMSWFFTQTKIYYFHYMC